jgi:hypothetical protein
MTDPDTKEQLKLPYTKAFLVSLVVFIVSALTPHKEGIVSFESPAASVRSFCVLVSGIAYFVLAFVRIKAKKNPVYADAMRKASSKTRDTL